MATEIPTRSDAAASLAVSLVSNGTLSACSIQYNRATTLRVVEQQAVHPKSVRAESPERAVLEAVGSPEATRLAIDLVRAGGTISAAGVHTEPQYAFSPIEAYDKNPTYRTGRCPARAYSERVLPLVRSQTYDLGAIISHRLPLAEGVRGYELFARRLDGCTKVILAP